MSEKDVERLSDHDAWVTGLNPYSGLYCAVRMGHPWAIPNRLIAPRDLLEALVDPDDCQLDHHGGCQAHGYLDLEPGELCPQARLRALLAQPQEEHLHGIEPPRPTTH